MMENLYTVGTPTSTKVKKATWKGIKILYLAIVLLLMYLPGLEKLIVKF